LKGTVQIALHAAGLTWTADCPHPGIDEASVVAPLSYKNQFPGDNALTAAR